MAHTLVGARVPGFHLRDEQAAVGQQNHAVNGKNDTSCTSTDNPHHTLGVRKTLPVSSTHLSQRLKEKHTQGLAVYLHSPISLRDGPSVS